MRVLLHLIKKEILQFRRDKGMLRLALVAPLVQLAILGYAANLDVTVVPTVLVDHDRTQTSRRLAESLVGSGYFELVATEASVQAVEPWMISGKAQIALVIDGSFAEDVAAGTRPSVQILADGSDSLAASIGLGYAQGVISMFGAEVLAERMGSGPALSVGQIDMVPRIWYNPELKSRWFYVPAVLAMVLMSVTLILASMGIVREKEIGTMEQLIVTPIRSWQLIVGKLLPYAVIGIIDMLLATAIVAGWFQVPLRGSLLLLLALTLLLLLNTLGLGLLVSALARTQQQAMMSSVFMVMIPMIYLSGLIFPIENMPELLQKVTYVIPLRYYAEILRGIFLKGSGIQVLWPQALALLLFGVFFLSLASVRFRKRLD